MLRLLTTDVERPLSPVAPDCYWPIVLIRGRVPYVRNQPKAARPEGSGLDVVNFCLHSNETF